MIKYKNIKMIKYKNIKMIKYKNDKTIKKRLWGAFFYFSSYADILSVVCIDFGTLSIVRFISSINVELLFRRLI